MKISTVVSITLLAGCASLTDAQRQRTYGDDGNGGGTNCEQIDKNHLVWGSVTKGAVFLTSAGGFATVASDYPKTAGWLTLGVGLVGVVSAFVDDHYVSKYLREDCNATPAGSPVDPADIPRGAPQMGASQTDASVPPTAGPDAGIEEPAQSTPGETENVQP